MVPGWNAHMHLQTHTQKYLSGEIYFILSPSFKYNLLLMVKDNLVHKEEKFISKNQQIQQTTETDSKTSNIGIINKYYI